jgi:hypothetical protein
MGIEKATGLPAAVMYPLRARRRPRFCCCFRAAAFRAAHASAGERGHRGGGVRSVDRARRGVRPGLPALLAVPKRIHRRWPRAPCRSCYTPALWFLAVRAGSCALLVPPVEELFWRGWAMRWIVASDFRKIPLGTYQAVSFWLVALVVRRRTRAVLGSRTRCGNHLQLVDGAHAQLVGLHHRPRRDQRSALGVHPGHAPVSVLALTCKSLSRFATEVHAEVKPDRPGARLTL